jgi:hypothetical protein
LDVADVPMLHQWLQGAGDGWWEDAQDPGKRGIGTSMVRAFVARLFGDP